MKIGFGKRILMFLHWLFSLLIFAAVVISICFPYLLNSIENGLSALLGSYKRIGFLSFGIAFGAIYLLLCIVQAGIIFKRRVPRSERGFITVDSSDNSRVRIAISAIEQMVRQSVYNIDGISDMKIAIENAEDAIDIKINASILSGRHVPTITMNMQQAIRKFVELNCGVAVKSVAVSINSVTAQEVTGSRKMRGKKGVRVEDTLVSVVPAASETVAEPAEIVEEIINTSEFVPDTQAFSNTTEESSSEDNIGIPDGIEGAMNEENSDVASSEENADKQA